MREKNEGFNNYTMLLIRHGFISPRESGQSAWYVWTRIAEDREVLKRVQKRMGKNFSGAVSGYGHGAAVLAAMNKRDLAALKERLGIRPDKEFAVR